MILISFLPFRVHVTFILKDGTKRTVRGKVGDRVLYLAHRHQIEMEGSIDLLQFSCFIQEL